MLGTVALRERGRLAALLNRILDRARRGAGWREPVGRTLRTSRQLVLGVLVARSTRLLALGRALLSQRRGRTVKVVAAGLGTFLAAARLPLRPLSVRLLEAAVRELPAGRLATYRGQALVVIDPTEYAKRSRGRGKRGRHMEHVGRVRAPRPHAGRRAPPRRADVGTSYGYVDVWAGLVLRRQQFLPLARQLFSQAHPRLASQNRVEEAVLHQALGLVRRAGLAAIAIGDRGLGRKELLVRLADRGQAFVFRIDADVSVRRPGTPGELGLATLLAAQPPLGEVVWNRGERGPLRCAVRSVQATFHFSRTGRRADVQAATLGVVELRPLDATAAPLVLATTLPAQTLAQAKGVAWVYGQRWAVETAFETLKAWGLGAFMVRSWTAIDRLLWLVALAYALAVLALRDPRLARLRDRAAALLRQQAVLGRRLTPGKLAEALGLDFAQHRRAWASCWLT
jgi:Transposase DDE domain